MVGEAGLIVVFEDGVSRDQGLDDNILDVVPHSLCVVVHGLQLLVEGGQLAERKRRKEKNKTKRQSCP